MIAIFFAIVSIGIYGDVKKAQRIDKIVNDELVETKNSTIVISDINTLLNAIANASISMSKAEKISDIKLINSEEENILIILETEGGTLTI